ncbi:MAG: amidohydrolase family protein [Proteobacteria bacterium]|nr:amidohydrolase family protein [Pseudomonadota bacterium]
MTQLGPQVTDAAPRCAAPDPNPRKPALLLPAGACDCHAHICGPADSYKYDDGRIYTPPDALLPDYLAMLDTLGVQRAVVIQPSVYGTDNSVTLAAIKESSIPCRGVAVIDETISDDGIAALDQAGIRGIRLNLVDVASPTGDMPLDIARRLAERIAPLGWHTEFLVHVDDYPDFDTLFADFPTDIVLGHLGYMRPDKNIEEPGFQALLRLMRNGRCWVKLTGPYRISSGDLPYPGVTDTAHALVDCAPDRIVWGSDWPHVMVTKPMPNDGELCDLLSDWVRDGDTRRKILVDNPARLYGF